jgi:hypothetical protein
MELWETFISSALWAWLISDCYYWSSLVREPVADDVDCRFDARHSADAPRNAEYNPPKNQGMFVLNKNRICAQRTQLNTDVQRPVDDFEVEFD